MSWFRRRAKPSKPPEFIRGKCIVFVGEQAGQVEDDLKERFHRVLASTPTVRSAYLAKLNLSQGEPSDHSVGLCIRSSRGYDHRLEKRIAQIVAEVFRADQHLDVLFMRADQEEDLRKVCRPFYERS